MYLALSHCLASSADLDSKEGKSFLEYEPSVDLNPQGETAKNAAKATKPAEPMIILFRFIM